MFYFWVLPANLVTAGCSTHEMVTKVKANVLVGREHHLLQVAGHQRDRVEQVLFSVDSSHWLRLLQLHRNRYLLIQERLIWCTWPEITAFRIVVKFISIFIGVILPEHVVDYLIVIFVPRMIFEKFYDVLAVWFQSWVLRYTDEIACLLVRVFVAARVGFAAGLQVERYGLV